MKVTRNKLFQELLQEISEISDLQKRGGCGLTQKAAYALSKNLTQATREHAAYLKRRNELLLEYCKLDNNGRPEIKMNEKNVNEFVFKSDEDKQKYLKITEDILNEEVPFTPHKISQSEIEGCQNIPVSTLSMMDQFELITEIELSSKKLNIVN